MSSRAARRLKLQQLKEARKNGNSLLSYEDNDDTAIYDEVDEDTFREHKRNQMMNDDFIVDDNGEGYVDNGIDEWDQQDDYSDEEEDLSVTKKRKRPVKVARTANIRNFFKPTGFNTTKKTENKTVDVNIEDILEDFSGSRSVKKKRMEGLFNSTKKEAPETQKNHAYDFNTTIKSNRKTNNIDFSSEPNFNAIDEGQSSLSPNLEPSVDGDDYSSDKYEDDVKKDIELNPIPSDNPKVSVKNEPSDSSDSENEVIQARRPRASAANRNHGTNFSAVKSSISFSSQSSYSQISSTEKLDESTIINADTDEKSFRMFWTDYSEVNDTILLFGKVETETGKFASAVVQVNGICKELYFLPRKYAIVEGEEDTSKELTPLDVHEEIVPLLMEQYGLDHIKAKPETKKYAFELVGIPKQADYLKILLPFQCPKNKHLIMPADLEGETFKHVFGANANIFESFVLQRNIMGPCWLEIKNPHFNSIRNTSHCQLEVSLDSANDITVRTDLKMTPPPLTATSISIQTILNAKQNKQEIVSVSIATYKNLPQDSPISVQEPDELVTLVRPVGSVSLPPGLQKLAEKQGISLRTFPHEKALLNCLAALIKNIDPDVFMGHKLENVSLDVLAHRMYDLKVPTWSAFGRRNRKAWPERMGRNQGGFNSNLQVREIFQGRLLCDIANELGQSLTPKCQSWDLVEMYDIVCHKKQATLDVDYQNQKFSEDANLLLMALKLNATSTKIIAEISFIIQILSLSKQLTVLAGNAWSHTLSGTRAGRNEFILLHEFQRNSYIVPDKDDRTHKSSNFKQQTQVESNEEDATTVTSNKKPKYQGGLVFEPEKGLHKNYVLVMDFNSLYPSIIQEFNICFTTVEREKYNESHDEEKDLPSLPESEATPGVLPKLLSNLVSRRREVKKLLKDPKISETERAQYDIKQQALKLTANSMYGCLGYINSRFYAKPLAMMVTNKGREILMDTRQLAESIGLRVVYGDTDSVMIDTSADNYAEAIKIGEEFKAHVNNRYKLLEIDIDNVFRKLLLHAKKKYAAMNSTVDKNTGHETYTLEVKGLDMRRREYCQLSKDISTFVLKKILSDSDPENALLEVYDYLEEMTKKIKDNEIPIDKFKINTRLSKDPNSYPNGKNMPPVQVALRLRKDGKVIKAGSVITYVIISPKDEKDHTSVAERARSIQDALNKSLNLKPDSAFYLEKQIFAPVERLIEKIEGADMIRIAKALDLDTKKYAIKLQNSGAADIATLEANVSDAERFRRCSYLVLSCSCGNKFRFGGLQSSHDYKVTYNGISCNKCGYVFPVLKVNSQLEYTIRSHVALYYEGWLCCDDSACGISTRQISVYGRRCLGSSARAHGCKGIMRFKYSDKILYNQLLYFKSIFSVDKAKKGELRSLYDSSLNEKEVPGSLPFGQLEALAEQNREYFHHCTETVEKYLADCGRRYVSMGKIFDFM